MVDKTETGDRGRRHVLSSPGFSKRPSASSAPRLSPEQPSGHGSCSGFSHTAVQAQHWEWSLLEGFAFCFDGKFHAGSPGVHTARHSHPPNPLSATGDGRLIDQPLPGHLRPCHLALHSAGTWPLLAPGRPAAHALQAIHVSSGGSHSTSRKIGCSRRSIRHCLV